MSRDLASLAVIAAIAALAPLVVAMLRLRVPEVVLLLLAGVLCGPQLLGWIELSAGVELFNEVGLGLLFFIAGYEVDVRALPRRSLRLGSIGWGASVLIAIALTAALSGLGYVDAYAAVAITLTSTSLGTLLPILQSKGLDSGPFGRLFFGAGFVGEFGPIIAIALLLGANSSFVSLVTLAVFAGFVVLVTVLPQRLAGDPLRHALARTATGGSLTGLRLALVLLLVLLAVASASGLDAVLGAFAAGAVLRFYSPVRNEHLMSRVEAVGFGLFVPLFFVVSGAALDVDSIMDRPSDVVAFFLLMLVARGLPQLLVYRNALPVVRDRLAFSLYTATGLPIIVAVATVSVDSGLMSTGGAAVLIGAGALSVIVFPFTADLVLGDRPPVVSEDTGGSAAAPRSG